MFVLMSQEPAEWRSQFVTSKGDRTGLRHAPMAFTEQGVAMLSSVSTRVLNQAVKRNRERFPEDFMFRLTVAEKAEVITNCDHLRPLRSSGPSSGFGISWPLTKTSPAVCRPIENCPRA